MKKRNKIFIDTSFWIALIDSKDQSHSLSLDIFTMIEEEYLPVTSDFVVYETVTYLNCSLKNNKAAMQFIGMVNESKIPVLPVDSEIRDLAFDILSNYNDKPLSFTDCTSFAIMKREDIRFTAAFDKHFKIMGFETLHNNL